MVGSPQTWVVIGASRGIGLEFVKQLLEAEHRVIATVRDLDNTDQLWSVIRSQEEPWNCMVEQCDVASRESIDKFAARMSTVVKGCTRLDNIIINAGVLKYPNRATELTFQDFVHHLTTNTIGPIICAQKLILLKKVDVADRNSDMGSIEIPWDCGVVLEADESVRGMLKVIKEKNSDDSGTFWCWDGRNHPW